MLAESAQVDIEEHRGKLQGVDRELGDLIVVNATVNGLVLQSSMT
jgi:hypothetical protein